MHNSHKFVHDVLEAVVRRRSLRKDHQGTDVMRSFSAIALLVGIVVAGAAYSQVRIGDSVYVCPVGASWNDPRCIRQPTSDGESARSSEQDARVPHWKDTWGAIYWDISTGSIGATSLGATEAGAEWTARDRCSSNGSRGCVKGLTFVNSCVAVAWPHGSGRGSASSNRELSAATAAAIATCKQASPGGCKVVYQACAVPTLGD